jgi:hypothetical protein
MFTACRVAQIRRNISFLTSDDGNKSNFLNVVFEKRQSGGQCAQNNVHVTTSSEIFRHSSYGCLADSGKKVRIVCVCVCVCVRARVDIRKFLRPLAVRPIRSN